MPTPENFTQWGRKIKSGWKKKAAVLAAAAFTELPIKLLEHHILGVLDEFIATHVGTALAVGGRILEWVIETPFSILICVIGVILLHAYWVSLFAPNIDAKYVRHTLMPRHPFQQLTEQYMQLNRQHLGPTEHDLLLQIYLVNRGRVTTVQKVEAEAQIDGQWVKLRSGKLQNYQIVFTESSQFGKSPLRTLNAKKEQLESLLDKTHEIGLVRGIGYSGWIAFEVVAEGRKLETEPLHFRVSIVDALEGRHPITKTELSGTDGEILHHPNVFNA